MVLLPHVCMSVIVCAWVEKGGGGGVGLGSFNSRPDPNPPFACASLACPGLISHRLECT